MSRILVVEDDEVLRNELIELLRNEGYEAEYISTFSDTAGQIIKSKPDLVLLDINIPELNGELVLRKLRKEADIPVIMVTSRTSERQESRTAVRKIQVRREYTSIGKQLLILRKEH